MSDVRNVRKGIMFTVVGGIFILMEIIFIFVMIGEFTVWLILFPLILCQLIPGFIFLYKGFPLKYRGLLLCISGILSVSPSIIAMVTLQEEFFTMFHTYIIVFLAVMFIVPAFFHIYLEFYKDDVLKVKKRLLYTIFYVSFVGLAFLVSFILFGFGFAPQNYIITNFWIIIGLSILIGLMFTGIIIVYRLLSGSTTLGETLRQIITAALGLIVAAISVILVLDIIFLP